MLLLPYCLTNVVRGTGPTHEHHSDNGSTSTIGLVNMSEPPSARTCEIMHCLLQIMILWARISFQLKKKPVRSEQTKGRLIWRYLYDDWDKTWTTQCLWLGFVIVSKHWTFMETLARTLYDDNDWSHIPNSKIRMNAKQSIVQSMRKRNRLFKKAKRTGDFSHYKLARNRILAGSAEVC